MGKNTLTIKGSVDLGSKEVPGRTAYVPDQPQSARIPKPAPGLVIYYPYLWHRESEEGQDAGAKNRPCLVIAVLPLKDGKTKPDVLVAPITHSEPLSPNEMQKNVEIPREEKKRLGMGMDLDASFVRCDEVNKFEWPGPDLQTVPGKQAYAFGLMDKAVFGQIQNKVLDIKGHIVRRDITIAEPEIS